MNCCRKMPLLMPVENKGDKGDLFPKLPRNRKIIYDMIQKSCDRIADDIFFESIKEILELEGGKDSFNKLWYNRHELGSYAMQRRSIEKSILYTFFGDEDFKI